METVKFKNMAEIATFAKQNSEMFFFEEESKQKKFLSGLVLDIYNDSRKADNYASAGIDMMDVITLHYKAASMGLSHMNGDFSIVKFGGKNPCPVVFTSYKREREDVLNSEIVAEFYPQIVYNGSKVVQRDFLRYEIQQQAKTAVKLDKDGKFDLTNVMGFAFNLVTTAGKKYTYFTTKEEIFFEIGKDEKMLFMYRSANAETMFYKFVMRKLLKWLPISLNGVKQWQEAEIIETETRIDSVQNSAEMSAFVFEKTEQPQQIEARKREQEDKPKKTDKPTLSLGCADFQKISEGVAGGGITSIAQIEENYTVPTDVANILKEML